MRIVQLTDFYPPTIGGVERHVETLSREFVRLGHDVTVITLQTGGLPDHETVDGVQLVRIRSWSSAFPWLYVDASLPFHPPFPDPGALAALRTAVGAARPDIVHSHSWLWHSYEPLYRTSADSPGHVVTLHDHSLGCAKKTYQHRTGVCTGPGLAKCLRCASAHYGVPKGMALVAGLRASRALNRRVDAYVAVSTAVAETSSRVLPAGKKIRVIPSMVQDDLEELAHNTPRPDFLPDHDGYLLFVGALGRHKGLDVLLEAHRRLRHTVPLVLIGTMCRDEPDVRGPGVTVALNVATPQVMAAWRHASVAVVPSVWQEGMGRVAVEAMFAGRPVVASDIGGLKDVVEDGVTGIRVPPGDAGLLAQALDRLLDDPVLRGRMGDAGRKEASRFTAGVVTPQLLRVFEDVLEERRRTAPAPPMSRPTRTALREAGQTERSLP
ncbi:glycosyltransferase involved in cell wall biosynthesis [Streptacidiphilus sp. MAP12-20]|uniref:glycosyltransferase family 4 protein n=1 Tax=Streptacidiphilus sp. MAP12-20 TaxID=3156299 RepID=UPI0035184217